MQSIFLLIPFSCSPPERTSLRCDLIAILQVAQACRSIFTSVVREVLLALGGYESKEVDGQVMATFHGPRQAVEWALALQCALLQVGLP